MQNPPSNVAHDLDVLVRPSFWGCGSQSSQVMRAEPQLTKPLGTHKLDIVRDFKDETHL